MSLLRRQPRPSPPVWRDSGHPNWCARGHRCGLGEHRAEPVIVEVFGVGRITVTRVRGRDGRQHAEVTGSMALDAWEPVARRQLVRLLAGLAELLTGRR